MDTRLAALAEELGISCQSLAVRGLPVCEEARQLEWVEVGQDGREHFLIPAAAQAWRRLRQAAREAGIELFVVSSFRSIDRQADIIRRKLRAGQSMENILAVSAPPGYSQHHTGRAVDVGTPGSPLLETEFEDTPAFAWLRENAGSFGFQLSYPPGNPWGYLYEPWHWYFVGDEAEAGNTLPGQGGKIPEIAAFLTELEELKLIYRAAYVRDHSRHENSAEHSWHLALGLLVLAREFKLAIDLPRALAMALIHDVCEIDAGDTPIYGPLRSDQHQAESRCIERLAGYSLEFGPELQALWHEFEALETPESRWVKVMDRLLPFVVNLANQGKAWQENGIARSQVLGANELVRQQAPEIFAWMAGRIDECVARGWLRDA